MTYSFDLDGTLCHAEFPDYTKAVPIWPNIEKVRRLYAEGHQIVIDTARGSGSPRNWYLMTALQLKEWNVPYHELRCGIKVVADIYVDDRGVNAAEFFGRL